MALRAHLLNDLSVMAIQYKGSKAILVPFVKALVKASLLLIAAQTLKAASTPCRCRLLMMKRRHTSSCETAWPACGEPQSCSRAAESFDFPEGAASGLDCQWRGGGDNCPCPCSAESSSLPACSCRTAPHTARLQR